MRWLLAAGLGLLAASTAAFGALHSISDSQPALFVLSALLLRGLQGVAAAAVDISAQGILSQ